MTKLREMICDLRTRHFLDPAGSNVSELEALISTALRATLDQQGEGPLFGLEPIPFKVADKQLSKGLPDMPAPNLRSHMESLPSHLSGSLKSNHPRMVKNVIPTPTLAYLASYLASSVYMGNGVSAEDAGRAALAEIHLARTYAELAGYDPFQAGGVFTFGGTGTILYAFCMGILAADAGFLLNGWSKELVVIGSRAGHYSHQTAVSWLGLGRDNYRMAKCLPDQTTDINDLERTCRSEIETGKRIACIVGSGGTTSCMAIDNFEDLSKMIDRLVGDYDLDYRPHLHADSVIGWSYLHYRDYDFERNSMGFTREVARNLMTIRDRIATLMWADTFGIDFHKTGYVPYTSSLLVARNRRALAALGRETDMMTPLFHDAVAYNPGKFTLETSRSSANMVATLMSVSSLGIEGFQALLGHAQEVCFAIKSWLNIHGIEFRVLNNDTCGSDVYVRAYPPSVSDAGAFVREQQDQEFRGRITRYNDELFAFLASHFSFGPDAMAIGKTNAAIYTQSGDPVAALRLYILNPFLDAEVAVDLAKTLVAAKVAFDSGADELGHVDLAVHDRLPVERMRPMDSGDSLSRCW